MAIKGVMLAALASSSLAAALHVDPQPVLEQGDRRPGPDAAQVTALLAALEKTDPVVCELAVDAFGNGWYGWFRTSGVGSLRDVPTEQRSSQVRVRRPVSDPKAVPVLVQGMGSANPCVRRASGAMLGDSRAAGSLQALRTGL